MFPRGAMGIRQFAKNLSYFLFHLNIILKLILLFPTKYLLREFLAINRNILMVKHRCPI